MSPHCMECNFWVTEPARRMHSSTKPCFVGELVMEKLKGVDEVAYVRFASVYRQFKDISTFMNELNKLLQEK